MLAELSQGRSCGQTARGGRASVCRVEFSYPVTAAAATDPPTAMEMDPPDPPAAPAPPSPIARCSTRAAAAATRVARDRT